MRESPSPSLHAPLTTPHQLRAKRGNDNPSSWWDGSPLPTKLSTHLRRTGFDVRTQMTSDVALVLIGNNPVNEAGDGFKTTTEYRSAVTNGASLLRLKDLVYLATLPPAKFAAQGR
ncbi:MAG: hypothetical protein ACI91B_002481 [Planctomycetota bacterium]